MVQNTYMEGEKIITNFTEAATLGLAMPDPMARIAVSAEGNYGDADDWGATLLTPWIIDHAGYQDRLVHYDYCSKTMSEPKHEKFMELATMEGVEHYGYDPSKFFNTQQDQMRPC